MSDIGLVHYIITSAQVWKVTRYDQDHTFWPAVLLLMSLGIYKAFVMEAFILICSLGNWTALLVRALVMGPILSTGTPRLGVPDIHISFPVSGFH